MFIELTEAEYSHYDHYKANKKIKVNLNNINYYTSYQSKGYGKGGNIISKLVFNNDTTIKVMENVKELDKLFKVRKTK